MKTILSLFTISLIMSGCATVPMPQTAAEYRQGFAQGGFGAKLESYTVNRPYSKVANTFKKNSKKCLNITVKKSKCLNNNCQDYLTKYTPTVLSNKKKIELHVQWERTPWDSTFLGTSGQPPAGGVYITVVDAVPAGKNKTKITVYGPSLDHLRTVPNAIKKWADGTNLGCPDLSQPYYY